MFTFGWVHGMRPSPDANAQVTLSRGKRYIHHPNNDNTLPTFLNIMKATWPISVLIKQAECVSLKQAACVSSELSSTRLAHGGGLKDFRGLKHLELAELPSPGNLQAIDTRQDVISQIAGMTKAAMPYVCVPRGDTVKYPDKVCMYGRLRISRCPYFDPCLPQWIRRSVCANQSVVLT